MLRKPSALLLICGTGVLLRIYVLYGQRTLWLDEAHLATSILNRTWSQIFLPLDNDQIAPVGFLLLSKMSLALTHNIGLGLRLPSFIAGTASIFCAWFLMRQKQISDLTAPIFIALICFLPPFVYYSFEFKQYSTELFFYMLIICCFEAFRRNSGFKSLCAIWISGLLCALCTITAPFILFFPGAYILVASIQKKDRKNAVAAVLMGLSWVALYAIIRSYTTPTQSTASMLPFWTDAMLPTGSILEKGRWVIAHFFGVFDAAGFAQASSLAALFAILGFSVCFNRDAIGTSAFLFPLLLTFAAALLHQYPFTGRLLLFCLPGVLFLVAEGITSFIAIRPLPNSVKTACLFLLMTFGIMPTIAGVRASPSFARDNLPKTIEDISKAYTPGQIVYVSSYALPIFRIYRDKLNVPPARIILGHDPRGAVGDVFNIDKLGNFSLFMDDLQQLSNKGQVWFLLSRLDDLTGIVTRTLAIYFCALNGKVVARYEHNDSAAYLCQFNSGNELKIAPDVLPEYMPIHKSYDILNNTH